jgi:AraC-like DNA-binding protein
MTDLPIHCADRPIEREQQSMADVLTQVLSTLRITTTLFAMADLPSPWGVSFPAAPGAYFHVLDDAEGWLDAEGHALLRLAPGDTVLLAHGTGHRLTSAPGGIPAAVFDPQIWTPNALVPGGEPPGARLVCGYVTLDGLVTHPLLSLLPAVLRIGRDDSGAVDVALTLRLLRRETQVARPGSQTLLARLGDVLLVQLIRFWAEREGMGGSGWLGALRDPQIGPALLAMHDDASAPWTVDSLAAVASLSRSRFAQRFHQLVGQPPLAYLTTWRMSLAAGLLQQGSSVSEAGHGVGYASEPAFSRAFTRHHGLPPSKLAAGTR